MVVVKKWKRMKSMVREEGFYCPECRKLYSRDEFDLEEDMCLYCLFPESSPIKPAERNDLGLNETEIRRRLDNLDYIPEKQSKKAKISKKSFENRKAYK